MDYISIKKNFRTRGIEVLRLIQEREMMRENKIYRIAEQSRSFMNKKSVRFFVGRFRYFFFNFYFFNISSTEISPDLNKLNTNKIVRANFFGTIPTATINSSWFLVSAVLLSESHQV